MTLFKKTDPFGAGALVQWLLDEAGDQYLGDGCLYLSSVSRDLTFKNFIRYGQKSFGSLWILFHPCVKGGFSVR